MSISVNSYGHDGTSRLDYVVATNSNFQTVCGSDGFHTLPQLTPGTYAITASSTGFKTYVQSGAPRADGAGKRSGG